MFDSKSQRLLATDSRIAIAVSVDNAANEPDKVFEACHLEQLTAKRATKSLALEKVIALKDPGKLPPVAKVIESVTYNSVTVLSTETLGKLLEYAKQAELPEIALLLDIQPDNGIGISRGTLGFVLPHGDTAIVGALSTLVPEEDAGNTIRDAVASWANGTGIQSSEFKSSGKRSNAPRKPRDDTPTPKALFAAIHRGDVNRVQDLLARGLSPNCEHEGFQAICKVCCYKKPEHLLILSELLNADADVNLRAEDDPWTALHYAAYFNAVDNIQLLLEHGAKQIKDTDGMTPHAVAVDNQAEAAAALLQPKGKGRK
jgi:hypothetical protein